MSVCRNVYVRHHNFMNTHIVYNTEGVCLLRLNCVTHTYTLNLDNCWGKLFENFVFVVQNFKICAKIRSLRENSTIVYIPSRHCDCWIQLKKRKNYLFHTSMHHLQLNHVLISFPIINPFTTVGLTIQFYFLCGWLYRSSSVRFDGIAHMH